MTETEEKRIAANGAAIYSYRNPALHGFFLSLFVRAGSLYERPSESGITHFLEHTAIRNIEKLSGGKLYRDLDRLGLEMNATTYCEMIQFYITGASGHFSEGAQYLAMLLAPMKLTPKEVDAERLRIKAEIRESDDKNSLTTFASKLIYRGTPLAQSVLGSLRTVNAQSAAKLEAYRRSVMTAENIFFYLTGNFTDEDLDALTATVGSYPIGHAPERKNEAQVPKEYFHREPEVAVKCADYTAVRFSFDLDMKKISIPETDLLYDILLSGNSSRFYLEMSEDRGWFYDITGAMERYANIGNFNFAYEVKERDLQKAVALTVQILNDFCERGVSEEDMMKANYVDNAMTLYDNAGEFNFSYAFNNHIAHLGFRTIGDQVRAYEAVTPERLREVARQIFRPENLVLTIKGNHKKIDPDELSESLLALGKREQE